MLLLCPACQAPACQANVAIAEVTVAAELENHPRWVLWRKPHVIKANSSAHLDCEAAGYKQALETCSLNTKL